MKSLDCIKSLVSVAWLIFINVFSSSQDQNLNANGDSAFILQERLLKMTLEERRKEYIRDYVPLSTIVSWKEEMRSKGQNDGKFLRTISRHMLFLYISCKTIVDRLWIIDIHEEGIFEIITFMFEIIVWLLLVTCCILLKLRNV